MAPPRVAVMPPVRREITDWDEFTGRFASTERVELRARVGGHLDAIGFADGQVVRRGDLLFRIDPRPFAAAVAEAEARLTAARSQLTLAQQEYDRAKNLLSVVQAVVQMTRSEDSEDQKARIASTILGKARPLTA